MLLSTAITQCSTGLDNERKLSAGNQQHTQPCLWLSDQFTQINDSPKNALGCTKGYLTQQVNYKVCWINRALVQLVTELHVFVAHISCWNMWSIIVTGYDHRVAPSLAMVPMSTQRLASESNAVSVFLDNWHTTNQGSPLLAMYSLRASGVFNIHNDGGGVGHVPQTTLVRSNGFRDIERLFNLRVPHANVEILQVERWVSITVDLLICLHDLLYLEIDEVVERVDVLLHKTFDFQKGGKEFPFVLYCWNRTG